jgi:hypothetical protein
MEDEITQVKEIKPPFGLSVRNLWFKSVTWTVPHWSGFVM